MDEKPIVYIEGQGIVAVKNEYIIWMHIEHQREHGDGRRKFGQWSFGTVLSIHETEGKAKKVVSSITGLFQERDSLLLEREKLLSIIESYKRTQKHDDFIAIYVEGGLVQDVEHPPWIEVIIVDADTEYEDEKEENERTLAEIAERKEKASWIKSP